MYIGRMAERVLCKYNLVVLIIFGNRWYKMLPEGGIRRAVSEFKNLQVCVQPCWIHGCISDRYSKQPQNAEKSIRHHGRRSDRQFALPHLQNIKSKLQTDPYTLNLDIRTLSSLQVWQKKMNIMIIESMWFCTNFSYSTL